jgi:WD40 repeat protein
MVNPYCLILALVCFCSGCMPMRVQPELRTDFTALLNPKQPLEAVAYSPNGRVLATGDGAIKLWQTSTNKQIGVLEGGSSGLATLLFSPDGGTLIAGGEDKIIRIWDLPFKTLRFKLKGHSDRIHSLAVSPDGSTLASVSRDKTIRIWDVSTGKILAILRPNLNEIESVAFCKNGQLLATGILHGPLIFWNMRTQKPARTFPGDGASTRQLCLSSDGDTLAILEWDDNIKMLNTRSWKVKPQLAKTASDHFSCVALRAYPKTPAARRVIQAQAKWRNPR